MVTVRIVVRVGVVNAVLLVTAYMHRVGLLGEGGCSNCKTRSEPGWNKTTILCIHTWEIPSGLFFVMSWDERSRGITRQMFVYSVHSLSVFFCVAGGGVRLRTE